MRRLSPRERLVLRWALRLVGLALLAWVFTRVDVQQMRARFGRLDPWLTFWAVAITVVVLAIKAWRWKILLRSLGIEAGYNDVLRLYAMGWYGGVISPGQLGEFLRIIPLIKRGDPPEDAFLSSLLDRLLDLVVLVLLGLAALYVLLKAPLIVPLGICLAGAAAAALFVLWMRRAGLPGPIARWTDRALAKLGQGNAERFRAHLSTLARRPWAVLTKPALLSLLAGAVIAFRAVLMGRALGIDTAWYNLFLAGAGASLLAILPISIQGIGTRDAAMIVLLGGAGVDSESAFSFSLFFLALMLGHGLIGWLVWTFGGRSLSPGPPVNAGQADT